MCADFMTETAVECEHKKNFGIMFQFGTIKKCSMYFLVFLKIIIELNKIIYHIVRHNLVLYLFFGVIIFFQLNELFLLI